jgi:FkbM family methyltransferase
VRWLKDLGIGVVYDVGANVGKWAYGARKWFPGAHLVCFEPVLECFCKLVEAGGSDPLFWAFWTALGDTDGWVKLHANDLSDASSMLEVNELHTSCWPESGRHVERIVPCRRLDSVTEHMRFDGKVLVKLDVQGAEDVVIRGGLKTLACTSVVVCETSFVPLYKGQCLFKDIVDLMYSLGFVYVGAMDKTLNRPFDDLPLEEDSIFVRKEELHALVEVGV